MRTLYHRIKDSLMDIYQLKDTSEWEYEPDLKVPIVGVYHVYCEKGWEPIVRRQMDTLRRSGLLERTSRFCVSVITLHDDDLDRLRAVIDTPKLEIIAVNTDPSVYEYPALNFIRQCAQEGDALFYYFHSKGISYQALDTNDRRFRSFVSKIVAWCEMLEYFIFDQWRVAVNTLTHGYDAYGCYQWPPREYTMFSGNFWWTTASYVRTLPAFDEEVIRKSRFYSEVWLYEHPLRVFSPFESSADLYFVRIPRSLYTMQHPPLLDHLRFVTVCNWRKMLKHVFRYNYKYANQGRYQKLIIRKNSPCPAQSDL